MDFDCFLSYNSRDRSAVRVLAARLAAAGVRVWFDADQLVPGRPALPLMAEGLAGSATAAVLIGTGGLGPWQDQEQQALLAQAVRDGRPVIPVLLPGAPAEPPLPPFLVIRTWVDLRAGFDGEGFAHLLWGIRGQRPVEAGAGADPAGATPPPGAGHAGPRLRIFLASPGDLADERRLARDLIAELPRQPGLPGACAVDLVAWDKPGGEAPMLATMNPQEAILADLARPSQCDIVVVLFGWRLGTPLDPDWQRRPDGRPYGSGTEWEYLDALAAAEAQGGDRPAILVYRKQGAPEVRADDPRRAEVLAQFDAVQAFFADFQNPDGSARRGWTPFESASDLAERLGQDLRALAARLLPARVPAAALSATSAAAATAATAERRWQGPPYPGLHALRLTDAPIFRGRGREVDDLLRLLGQPGRRALTLVGASGSGKSSLVWAGLLPRLIEGNALPGSKDWRWVRFTPAEQGDDPFANLAGALAREFHHCRWEPRALALDLAAPDGIGAALDRVLARAPDWAECLLFVDQLEEVFRLPSADLRARFCARLAAAAARPRVRVLATLRADFVAELPGAPHLADLYNQGSYLLLPPLQPARVRMVTEPAARAGRALEPGLADRIVADTGDQPGALPLMAYALERLWERDQDRPVLTHASYAAGGGVRGAIATQAERVFTDFAAEAGEAAGAALAALFGELVAVEGAESPATRRRAPLARLGSADGAPARLAERLVRARLLVKDQGAAGPVVDVAHEALLSGWDRLARWIEERRDDLRLCDLLRRSVEDWARGGFHHSLITLGPERAETARAALARLGQTPDPREHAFLDPAARAAWLLERDWTAWVATGRGARGLWDAERFRGFAGLAPGILPEPAGAARDFLAASFAAGLERHPDDPRLRCQCGQALGAIGDPRFDPACRHLPADPTLGFREVPAGPFRMGTDPAQDPDGWSDERPQHDQDLPAYWIARWPVTVAQFAAYVADGGQRPIDADALRGHPNHPVVYVTWHEARAYCAWHGERLRAVAADRLAALDPAADPAAARFWEAVAAGRLAAGLPSEPEWEKAARGTDARVYPWGGPIAPELANYKDTGLKTTSAVGCFPAGAGPYGCEDQSGNVWEWTRSLWGPDWQRVGFPYRYRRERGCEDQDAGDDVARVLRGGAFSVDSYNCRAAVRYRTSPRNRCDYLGFRVVWSPFLCTLTPLDSEPLKPRKRRFGWF